MQMKTLPLAIMALATGIMTAPAATADGCTSSFYCYGNSAAETVRTATRPPPIPPPNPNYTRQRNQAQFAARNNQRIASTATARTTVTTAPATPVSAPATQPRAQVNTPVLTAQPQIRRAPATIARPQTRANPPARTTPPPSNPVFRVNARPVPPATNAPPLVDRAGCVAAKQNLLGRAKNVESQAVIASTRGDRQRSVALFKDAGRMRSDAQRMQCH